MHISRREENISNFLDLVLLSEKYDGELMDTEVKIADTSTSGSNFLCTISGNELENFVMEFKALINKYQI